MNFQGFSEALGRVASGRTFRREERKMANLNSKLFTRLLRVMGFLVFIISMVAPRAAWSEDTVLFGFENGDLHEFAGGNAVNDSSHVFAGNGALRIVDDNQQGDTFYADVARWAPVGAPPGTNLTLHVYAPAGTSASLLIYLVDADYVYWFIGFADGGSLAADTWKKVSLEIPAEVATPLMALDVQIYASAPATLWIDSIGYELPGLAATALDDEDGDGIPDGEDNCPAVSNPGQADADKDGEGDVCDEDNDADGISDVEDNCIAVANPNQEDMDGDGIGDACDEDIDGDGIPNGQDNCLLDLNPDQKDFDGDLVGDACDEDGDQDGVIDARDACLETPSGAMVGDNGCSIDQTCPLDNNWTNRHAYIRCVAYTATKYLASGLITKRQRDAAVYAALRKVKEERMVHKKDFQKRASFRFEKRERYTQQHQNDGKKKEKSAGTDSRFGGFMSRFFHR